MKLFSVGIVSLLILCQATAQDQSAAGIRPQPRLRLDPSRQAAVTVPVENVKAEAEAPVTLERLVVKDTALFRDRRPAVEDPTGEFTLRSGGRFLRRDIGGVRIEIGIWPYIDLFAEEARFKPTKTGVYVDFLRIKF